MEEEAIFATHRPSGWEREQHYVVIRRRRSGAQVLLRAVQYTALPKGARRHGIRSVIRHVAAHMVRTGRRVVLRFAKTNFRLDWLYQAMTHLEARAPPPAPA